MQRRKTKTTAPTKQLTCAALYLSEKALSSLPVYWSQLSLARPASAKLPNPTYYNNRQSSRRLDYFVYSARKRAHSNKCIGALFSYLSL